MRSFLPIPKTCRDERQDPASLVALDCTNLLPEVPMKLRNANPRHAPGFYEWLAEPEAPSDDFCDLCESDPCLCEWCETCDRIQEHCTCVCAGCGWLKEECQCL